MLRKLLLIWALFLVISISGCTETSSYKNDETTTLPHSYEEYIDRDYETQDFFVNEINILGNYKTQDVSGDQIKLVGNYNEIKILNSDVSLIMVTGNYNTIYYPTDARPTIKETGNENVIITY